MTKQVTVTDSEGNERQMYLQEEGSCVSTVSPNENSSWKTEENVFNSSIKEFTNGKRDSNKEYFDTPQLKMEDPRDNVTIIVSSSNSDSYDDCDDDDNSFNTSNCSDDWESNCGGADVPDYIKEGTAYFDEEGNYAGGTMADQSDD